jgi:hypothetical protein
MVLHSIVYHVCVILILTHIWDAFGFPCKIGCDRLVHTGTSIINTYIYHGKLVRRPPRRSSMPHSVHFGCILPQHIMKNVTWALVEERKSFGGIKPVQSHPAQARNQDGPWKQKVIENNLPFKISLFNNNRHLFCQFVLIKCHLTYLVRDGRYIAVIRRHEFDFSLDRIYSAIENNLREDFTPPT